MLLNLLFVVVFHLGVSGVAIVTGLSTALSAGLVLRRLTKNALFRLRFRPLIFAPGAIGEILKTGVPSAEQGAVFCFANLFVQASVNTFGATAIAGSTIALNLEYFTYYCNHRLRPNRHHLHQPKPCGLATRAPQKNPTALPVVFHPLQPFDDWPHRPVSQCVLPAVYRRSACCSKRLRPHSVYPVFFESVCNLYEIPAAALRSAGHPLLPASAIAIGPCTFRILWICTVFAAHPALSTLYHAFPLSWLFTICLVALSVCLVRPFAASKTPRP